MTSDKRELKVVVYNHYSENSQVFSGASETEVEAKLIECFDFARFSVPAGDLGLLVEYLNSQQAFDAWVEVEGKAMSGEQWHRRRQGSKTGKRS